MLAISGLSRGFNTCCLRFKSGVAITHAKLASGWLARLYREGVEPSGSLQKVSDHILVPLFWIYPGARKAGCPSGAFLGDRRLKPAPDIRRPPSSLHPPFVHFVVATVVRSESGLRTRSCTAMRWNTPPTPGALARVRVVVSRSVIT